MGHVLRKDKDDWVRRSVEMAIEGKRGAGRPRMTWVKAVESDMKDNGLMREDAEDRTKSEQKANSYNSRKNSLKTFVVVEVRVFVQIDSQAICEQSGAQEAIAEASTNQVRHQFVYMKVVCGTGLLRWQR